MLRGRRPRFAPWQCPRLHEKIQADLRIENLDGELQSFWAIFWIWHFCTRQDCWTYKIVVVVAMAVASHREKMDFFLVGQLRAIMYTLEIKSVSDLWWNTRNERDPDMKTNLSFLLLLHNLASVQQFRASAVAQWTEWLLPTQMYPVQIRRSANFIETIIKYKLNQFKGRK